MRQATDTRTPANELVTGDCGTVCCTAQQVVRRSAHRHRTANEACGSHVVMERLTHGHAIRSTAYLLYRRWSRAEGWQVTTGRLVFMRVHAGAEVRPLERE